tara:strand:- start:509 stop:643 length:135 start_codon:yes stop_codon:yes gene_type:complete
MKKALSVLALIAVLALAACSQPTEEDLKDNNFGQIQSEETVVIC